MTRVNRMMAYEFESSTAKKEYDGKKQIPSIATRLTAEVYFPPKKVFQEQVGQLLKPMLTNFQFFIFRKNCIR